MTKLDAMNELCRLQSELAAAHNAAASLAREEAIAELCEAIAIARGNVEACRRIDAALCAALMGRAA